MRPGYSHQGSRGKIQDTRSPSRFAQNPPPQRPLEPLEPVPRATLQRVPSWPLRTRPGLEVLVLAACGGPRGLWAPSGAVLVALGGREGKVITRAAGDATPADVLEGRRVVGVGERVMDVYRSLELTLPSSRSDNKLPSISDCSQSWSELASQTSSSGIGSEQEPPCVPLPPSPSRSLLSLFGNSRSEFCLETTFRMAIEYSRISDRALSVTSRY